MNQRADTQQDCNCSKKSQRDTRYEPIHRYSLSFGSFETLHHASRDTTHTNLQSTGLNPRMLLTAILHHSNYSPHVSAKWNFSLAAYEMLTGWSWKTSTKRGVGYEQLSLDHCNQN